MKKILGLILLSLGVLIVLWSLWSSYNIFSGKQLPPEIFKQTEEEAVAGEGIQDQVKQAIEEQLGKLIPADSITSLLNLISWSVLASILIFGGSKIASLGVQLLNSNKKSKI